MKPVSSSDMGRARKSAQRSRVAHQGPASSEPAHDASAEPAAPSLPAVGLEWRRALDAIADPICMVTSSYEMIYANTAYIAPHGIRLHTPRPPPLLLRCPHAGGAASGNVRRCCPRIRQVPWSCVLTAHCLNVVGSGRVAFLSQEEAALEVTGTANPRLYERWIYPVSPPTVPSSMW